MHEIKISFLRNDARDMLVTTHVNPQDVEYMVLVRIVPFAMRRVVPTFDSRSKGSTGTPLKSRIRRTYAEAGERSVIVLFTTLERVR